MSVLYGRAAAKELDDNYSDWATLIDGDEVKTNHTTCPMGEDTRNRMNIINKGGAFLWHCFNCSESGYYRSREYASMLIPKTYVKVGPPELDPIRFLANCDADITKFSTEARLWLAQYEMLDQSILNSFAIRYCPKSGSVVLPVWQGGSIVGTQSRMFNGKLKYYTQANKTSAHKLSYENPHAPLFIVEDLLSAYKLHCAGASVWCLMGTSIKGDFVQSQKETVLWLDSDLAGESAALKLCKELAPLYPNLVTVFNQQPKELSFDELKKLVKEHTK